MIGSQALLTNSGSLESTNPIPIAALGCCCFGVVCDASYVRASCFFIFRGFVGTFLLLGGAGLLKIIFVTDWIPAVQLEE